MGGEITKSKDLIKVAYEYGNFYCLQDYLDDKGRVHVSLIRTCGDDIRLFTNNDEKAWEVSSEGFKLINNQNIEGYDFESTDKKRR